MADLTQPFWRRKSLDQLDQDEWEALCDGCGLCCLQKLEDEEQPGAVYYTDVACKLLDLNSCQCKNYPGRKAVVPDCVQLTPADAAAFAWLPPTCAYRLLAEGEELPAWHHLVCADRREVHRQGISRAGRMLAEDALAEDDWEERIIFRVG